jgi:hypothetical protein
MLTIFFINNIHIKFCLAYTFAHGHKLYKKRRENMKARRTEEAVRKVDKRYLERRRGQGVKFRKNPKFFIYIFWV